LALNPYVIKGLGKSVGDSERNIREGEGLNDSRSLSGHIDSVLSKDKSGGIFPFRADVDDVSLASVIEIDGSIRSRIGLSRSDGG